MASDPDPLSQETALALLVLLPALGRVAEDATRAEGAISTTQARFVHALLPGPLRGVEIADRLRTTRAAVAELAQRLEGAGLVRSRPDPADGRARLVEITPEGRAAIEHFGRVTTRAIGRVLDPLPSPTRVALRDALGLLEPLVARASEPER